MRHSYGFSVVEINQASHRPEVVEETIRTTRWAAQESADGLALEADAIGRRERYIVVELIGVEDE